MTDRPVDRNISSCAVTGMGGDASAATGMNPSPGRGPHETTAPYTRADEGGTREYMPPLEQNGWIN